MNQFLYFLGWTGAWNVTKNITRRVNIAISHANRAGNIINVNDLSKIDPGKRLLKNYIKE
jgi:hypothetical protein